MSLVQTIPAVGRAVEREFRTGAHARSWLRGRTERRVRPVCRPQDAPLLMGNVDLAPLVRDWLQRERDERLARRDAEIARLGRDRERTHMAHGYQQCQIHPVDYKLYGEALGYECWQDKDFVRFYLRQHDYARITSRSRHPSVGWTPAMEGAARTFKQKQPASNN